MKKIVILTALLSSVSLLSAQSFFQVFTGSFTDGTLAGFTIEGEFEIDRAGQTSGTAEYLPVAGPEILAFTFEILDLSSMLFTDFIETDDPLALATFDIIAPSTDPQVTTFDFVGTNFAGESLDFFYDAFAATPDMVFAVSFDDGLGDVSNATLDLAVNVPEPGTYALIMGVVATGLIVGRRRRG
ncbi:MAG: PEP-CTERM sorting domain-containing protein [Verrucomicrobiota bacterium]